MLKRLLLCCCLFWGTLSAPVFAGASQPPVTSVKVVKRSVSIPSDKTHRCPKWEPLMKRVGLEPIEVFSYLAWRESRCTPKAVGWNYRKGKSVKDCKLVPYDAYRKCSAVKSYDSGLWQVNSSWKTVTAQVCKSPQGDMTVLFDPLCNAKVAKYLLDNGGFNHWSLKR